MRIFEVALLGALLALYLKLQEVKEALEPEDRVEIQGFSFDPDEDPYVPDEVE